MVSYVSTHWNELENLGSKNHRCVCLWYIYLRYCSIFSTFDQRRIFIHCPLQYMTLSLAIMCFEYIPVLTTEVQRIDAHFLQQNMTPLLFALMKKHKKIQLLIGDCGFALTSVLILLYIYVLRRAYQDRRRVCLMTPHIALAAGNNGQETKEADIELGT